MSKSQYKILEYPAIFDPAQEGGYNVSFPAFPGCVTFGQTFEEAKAKAGEVLKLWLEELANIYRHAFGHNQTIKNTKR